VVEQVDRDARHRRILADIEQRFAGKKLEIAVERFELKSQFGHRAVFE
jgi:hypothetical protein